MRLMFALQRGVVSRFSESLLISLFMVHVLCGQTFTVAQRNTSQQKNAGTPDLAPRIKRVENGLLPVTAMVAPPARSTSAR